MLFYYKTFSDVAMILIITMVAKIYFPEALERKSPQESSINTRNVNYRRVEDEELNDKSSNYYSSDEEDLDDDDEDGALMKSYSEDASNSKASGRSGRSVSVQDISKTTPEINQENMSRSSILRRLAFCVIMLNVTFVTWGVLQERMLTRRYPRFTGEFFTYSYALVFTNRFWTLVMSGMLMLYLKPRRSCSTVLYEYSFPSISNMLSSWCQYESLRYVSFPAVTLFKSFKLAPVMAMGKFLGNKQCKSFSY